MPTLNLRNRLLHVSKSAGIILVLVAVIAWHALQSTAHAQEVRQQSPDSAVRYQQIDSFERLCELAARNQALPAMPVPGMPARLAALQYDQYRQITFKHPAATWYNTDSPFWLETFHRGFAQKNQVELFTIQDGNVAPIPFSSDHFDYGSKLGNLGLTDEVGHAGLKVVGRFPQRNDGQEMLTFLGASYFRGRSAETVYGSSARGLALNIATDQPEEFPAFRVLWIERAKPGARQIRVLALLESPSVCGAYQFDFTPGIVSSIMHVKAKLFFRESVARVGIAPLTTMWIWGDGLKGPPRDSRPSVHDSDGLLIHSQEDGWIRRAYARQSYPSVSYRKVKTLLAFGVLQRNRAFLHYDDHNAKYHLRPGIWVTPDQPWKNGRIELLELPGAHEGIDNVATYWVPDEPFPTDTPLELEYDVEFFPGDPGAIGDLARATNFDVKRTSDRERQSADSIELEVRFAGPLLAGLTPDSSLVADVRLRDGALLSKTLEPTETDDWLVTIRFRLPDSKADQARKPVDIEISLLDAGKLKAGKPMDARLSETFWYLCPPEQPTFIYPAVYTRLE